MDFVGIILFYVLFLKLSTAVIVQTRNGPVLGAVGTSEYGRTYFSFQGIPYAKPVVGDLKFRVMLKFAL